MLVAAHCSRISDIINTHETWVLKGIGGHDIPGRSPKNTMGSLELHCTCIGNITRVKVHANIFSSAENILTEYFPRGKEK